MIFSGGAFPSPAVVLQVLNTGIGFLFLAGYLAYFVFAIIAWRQIQVMTSTVQTSFTPVIRVIGVVHLVVAFAALIFAFMTLQVP